MQNPTFEPSNFLNALVPMQINPFQAIFPRFDLIDSPDVFCEGAKDRYAAYQAAGLFTSCPQSALYIYQIADHQRRHTGLVAMNNVEDFFGGKVKKHEKTLSEKEQQQVQLFLQWEAVLKPVLLTYPPVAPIAEWLDRYVRKHKPIFSTQFSKSHQHHRAWAVTAQEDILALQQLFAAHVHSTYIADGHHRTSTTALLHEAGKELYPRYDFDHLFCAFFAADQLDILDYNRVVEGLDSMSAPSFIVLLSHFFEMELLPVARRPTDKHEVVMLLRKEWYSLRWKQSVLDNYPPDEVLLDANLLNELVMNKVFGILDVRTDQRIIYVEGSKGLRGIQKQVGRSRLRVGFMLYPVTFDDMMRLADLGESLPPKSTYFEPRLRSGILVKSLLRTEK